VFKILGKHLDILIEVARHHENVKENKIFEN